MTSHFRIIGTRCREWHILHGLLGMDSTPPNHLELILRMTIRHIISQAQWARLFRHIWHGWVESSKWVLRKLDHQVGTLPLHSYLENSVGSLKPVSFHQEISKSRDGTSSPRWTWDIRWEITWIEVFEYWTLPNTVDAFQADRGTQLHGNASVRLNSMFRRYLNSDSISTEATQLVLRRHICLVPPQTLRIVYVLQLVCMGLSYEAQVLRMRYWNPRELPDRPNCYPENENLQSQVILAQFLEAGD